jgi:LPS export ABC transporter protein LptC
MAVAFFVTVLLFLSAACSNKKEDFVRAFKDRSSVPGMSIENDTTLISDSGVIRYSITCRQWIVYDKVKEPYWYFPNKLHFERFGDNMSVESVMDCDTARYYSSKRLWEFKKNVRIVNLQGDVFETQLLYWDQREQKIYSDSFIRIEQKKMILSGYGFESNQTFTKYDIFKPNGPIDMDSSKDSTSMYPTQLGSPNSNVVAF